MITKNLKNVVNSTISSLFAGIVVIIAMFMTVSCEKEDRLLQTTTVNNIQTFSSTEEYVAEVNKVANMTYEELCEYENVKGFYSLGRKCDEIYSQANPKNFNSREEFVQFVESNSEYIELVTDSNNELTLEIKSGFNSNRYLVGEDGLFRISNNLYKVIDNFTIITNNNNIEKIKRINALNYQNYFEDSTIMFPSYVKQPQNKTTAGYYDIDREAINGNEKTKIFMNTWAYDHSQQNDTYLQSDFVVRPYHKTLWVWYYCSRTLSWDIDAKLVAHFGDDIWAGWLIDENESGVYDSYRSHTWFVWLDHGLDNGGYSDIYWVEFDWCHFWGSSPDAGPASYDIY